MHWRTFNFSEHRWKKSGRSRRCPLAFPPGFRRIPLAAFRSTYTGCPCARKRDGLLVGAGNIQSQYNSAVRDKFDGDRRVALRRHSYVGISSFWCRIPWDECQLVSVANLTRADARIRDRRALQAGIKMQVTHYPLAQANACARRPVDRAARRRRGAHSLSARGTISLQTIISSASAGRRYASGNAPLAT